MAREGYITCEECSGTGSTEPDCKVCKGYRSIKVRTAYAHGYRKADLADVESDGFCECPACDGDMCDMCEGSGEVQAIEAEQQLRRVLIQAKEGRIPPLISLSWRGQVHFGDNLLSMEAARRAKRDGLITWWCSVFGDELRLTSAGERAYSDLYRTD
jgi:hypothetical protein